MENSVEDPLFEDEGDDAEYEGEDREEEKEEFLSGKHEPALHGANCINHLLQEAVGNYHPLPQLMVD